MKVPKCSVGGEIASEEALEQLSDEAVSTAESASVAGKPFRLDDENHFRDAAPRFLWERISIRGRLSSPSAPDDLISILVDQVFWRSLCLIFGY